MIPFKEMRISIVLAVLIIGTAAAVSAASSDGDQIWSEAENMPSSYTWTPQTFSGFYNDPALGRRTEEIGMAIDIDRRRIDEGDIEYTTTAENTSFVCEALGRYRFIALFGAPYAAGFYKNDSKSRTTVFSETDIDFLEEKILPRVLIDTAEEKSLRKGENISLKENYTITVSDIDGDANEVRILLKKNGKEVDDAVVSEIFVYQKTIGGVKDVPIIVLHIDDITSNRVNIGGVFQISDSPEKIEEGTKKKNLRVTHVADGTVRMENPSRIGLDAGSVTTLAENMEIRVTDNDDVLCFELTTDENKSRTIYSLGLTGNDAVYGSAGAVFDSSGSVTEWTGLNFPGFFYDAADDRNPEELSLTESVADTIPKGGLTYTTRAIAVSYAYEKWGTYRAIRIGDETYFAGNDSALLGSGAVSEILIDSAEKTVYTAGAAMNMKEGYTVAVGNIGRDGNETFVEMTVLKDGKEIASRPLRAGDDLIYKSEINGVSLPILTLHASAVDGDKKTVTIDGVFRISENEKTVKAGTVFDRFEVEGVGRDSLRLVNKEKISLKENASVTLFGKTALYVGSTDPAYIFPYVAAETEAKADNKTMKMTISQPQIRGEEMTVTATDESGKALGGVRISLDGVVFGETNDSGLLTIVPQTDGNMSVKASLLGYRNAETNITVEDPAKILKIELPERIYDGDKAIVRVITGTGVPVGGLVFRTEVDSGGSQESVDIGTSNESGMITITASPVGSYDLSVSGDGYYDGRTTLMILEKAPFMTMTDIVVDAAEVGKKGEVLVTVENRGRLPGTLDVAVSYNGSAETKTAQLEAGETEVLSYTVTPSKIGEQSLSVNGEHVTFTVGGKISLFQRLKAAVSGQRATGDDDPVGKNETADKNETVAEHENRPSTEPEKGEAYADNENSAQNMGLSRLWLVVSFIITVVMFVVLAVLAGMMAISPKEGGRY